MMINETEQRKVIRRHGDEELRKSEERYRAFVEHSSEAVWCVDIDPPCPLTLSVAAQVEHLYQHISLTECNDVMAQMFGFSNASDIIGLGLRTLLPRSRPGNVAYLNAFITSNYHMADVELQEPDIEGNIKCSLNNLVGIIGDDGLARIWGTKRDITKRKEAENALRESEERYERLVELSPDAIIVHSDLRVTFCNTAAANLVGAPSAKVLIGQPVFDFVADSSREMLYNRIVAIHKGESFAAVECKCKRLNGSSVDVEIQSVVFTSCNGPAIQTVIRDVSERKQAEAALQEANERAIREYERLVERIATLGQILGQARELESIFRALREFTVASVPCDGMVISLHQPDESARKATYCWVDGAERDMADLNSIPVKSGLTGRAMKSGTIVIDNEYQKNISPSYIVVGKCEEGSIPQSALSAPMIARGRIVGCIEIQSYEHQAYKTEHSTAMKMAANLAATAVENVELLEREQENAEQLRQSQKMDAVGQLAGGVAHDFNNLLTVITGYSELGIRGMAADAPMRRNLEEIKKAGERAASLTRQLLAFSRKQMFQEQMVDLNSVVADMDKMLQRLIGEDIDMVSLLEPDLCQIKADPGQIEQVLLNLAVNARDAMPRGGKLTIETSQALLDQDYFKSHLKADTGRYVVLAVSDTGTGMDAETKKHIFEPFFTTKGVGKGTGLGLATVYGIVRQSGGNIWVYSEPGKGSTFKIYLPIAEESALAEIDAQPKEIPQGRGTILLVEDEDSVRNLACEILAMKGYRVLTAANGADALKVSADYLEPIDLMLTDVVMPHLGGRELAEQMALIRSETIVLYMSGYTDDAVVRHGVLDDEMPFLQKPFTPDTLARKVGELLEKGRGSASRS
jgi:PAS domain S-box-containing protein